MRVRYQTRLVVGPARQQHEHPGGGDPIQAKLDQLERRWIDPMHVLDQHQHRLPGGEGCQLLDEGSECAVAQRLRAEVEWAIAGIAGEAEEVERRAPPPLPGCRMSAPSRHLEPVEPLVHRLPRGQASGLLEVAGLPARARNPCGRASIG